MISLSYFQIKNWYKLDVCFIPLDMILCSLRIQSSVRYECLFCCSMLQCVAVLGSVLHCVAVCQQPTVAKVVYFGFTVVCEMRASAACCSVWQCVALCCSVNSQYSPKISTENSQYGVASISTLHKIIGLFCKRGLWKRWYSAKETYNLKEPTNRSHPIV